MNPFGQLEILSLDANNPRLCGKEHGSRLRKGIHRMSELRLKMMLDDTDFTTEGEILALARQHLPILKAFDESLYEELMGIAEGADISPELVVVINHYTDMRDIRKSSVREDDGGCSVIFTPTKSGPILGQTWDVHGSAMEHVFIMRLKDQLIFSVAGCLGMTGMNTHGVGITINNLSSYDAKIGIVWPALVRKVLKCQTAEQGKNVVLNAPLGSGHHYVIADKTDLVAIETSGSKKKITQDSSQIPHIHTNHCLDSEMRETHSIRKGSTTFERYTELEKILKDGQLETSGEVYEQFGRVCLDLNPDNIHQTTTCGALVMDLAKGEALASKGPPSDKFFQNPALTLKLDMTV